MKKNNVMLIIIFIMTLAFSITIVADVFIVSVNKTHVLSNTDLTEYTNKANIKRKVLKAERGTIYDRDGVVIVQDNKTFNIVCILDENRLAPKGKVAYVDNPKDTAAKLATLLGGDEEEIYALLTKDTYQTELGLIGRNLSREKKEEIESYNLNGIEFVESIQRIYPLGTFSSHTIGFAQSDENGSTVGKMGLELILEEELSGTDGIRIYQADKNGYTLPGMKIDETNAINGNNVTLTIDQEMQEALEEAFLETEENFDVDRIWGSVMEVDSGKILAWGQYPSFDPNKLDVQDYNNYGTQLPYEPGSTMKTFTWAAAIDSGKYDGKKLVDSSPFCFKAKNNNPYRVESGGFGCISNANYKTWGMIEYDYGLIYSSNTVTAALLTEVITPDIFEEYLDKFHFFQPVNTDGIPEEVGFKNYKWPSEKITSAYGQGSTVTMLQMLQAYSAVFSDGTMVKPHFVERITDSYDNQKVIYQAQREVVGNPITEETAKELQTILRRVIEEDGTGNKYKIPEVEILGKTGTTVVAKSGNYDSGKTIASVAVGIPASDPQYIVYYAFEDDYNPNAHVFTDHITTLFRKVAMHGNITNSSNQKDETDGEEVEIVIEDMPSLINQSVDFALESLDGINANITVLGTGDRVIDQFPNEYSPIVTNQKVFFLTDTAGFYMPDMTGWTRKDIISFWEVSGIAIKFSGSGSVVSQNITTNSFITKDTNIEVELE
ncbi:MAG: penicillin-binding protein [Anaerorhabdus sp.]